MILLLSNPLVRLQTPKFMHLLSFRGEAKITFHLVSPHVPAGGLLSGKQLHAGQVAHKGNDFIPHNVGLFAVLLHRGHDDLMDTGALTPGPSSGRQQAEFHVGPCPVAHAPEQRRGLFVELYPDKSNRLVGKSPCVKDG